MRPLGGSQDQLEISRLVSCVEGMHNTQTPDAMLARSAPGGREGRQHIHLKGIA